MRSYLFEYLPTQMIWTISVLNTDKHIRWPHPITQEMDGVYVTLILTLRVHRLRYGLCGVTGIKTMWTHDIKTKWFETDTVQIK